MSRLLQFLRRIVDAAPRDDLPAAPAPAAPAAPAPVVSAAAPEPAPPTKTYKFGEKVVSGRVPPPTAVNVFFGHVSPGDVQLMLGVSNFITEEVTPLFVVLLSPQKVRELRDFLTNVIQAHEAKFGPPPPPPDDSNGPPIPPTILH